VNIYTRACPVCGERVIIKVDEAAYKRWKQGELIQRCFPDWTADQRERLVTGLHGECWKKYLGPDPDDDDEDDDE
jgi:hypothetical protein